MRFSACAYPLTDSYLDYVHLDATHSLSGLVASATVSLPSHLAPLLPAKQKGYSIGLLRTVRWSSQNEIGVVGIKYTFVSMLVIPNAIHVPALRKYSAPGFTKISYSTARADPLFGGPLPARMLRARPSGPQWLKRSRPCACRAVLGFLRSARVRI